MNSTNVAASSSNFGILARHAMQRINVVQPRTRAVHYARRARTVLQITVVPTPTMKLRRDRLPLKKRLFRGGESIGSRNAPHKANSRCSSGVKLRSCHGLRSLIRFEMQEIPAAASRQMNGISGARIRMLLQYTACTAVTAKQSSSPHTSGDRSASFR